MAKKKEEKMEQKVEQALLTRALGCTYEEKVFERVPYKNEEGKQVFDENGRPMYEEVVVKRVVKESPPDLSALMFWLKAKMPEEWNDKREENLEVQSVVVKLPKALCEEED